ncbi:MAG: PCMD domain-containing protein [Bacteroidota bacterium]
MKEIVFSALFFYSIFINAQSIPNADFENWETLGSGMNSYQEPTNWNTLNSDLSSYFVSADVTKSSDSHAGISSAKLETKSVAGIITPAVLTLGTIYATGTFDRDVRGGVPCSQKPLLFEGWYKFSSQGSDKAYIASIMYKYNNITKKQDTVGAAIFMPSTSISQYTKFSVSFDYNSYMPNETPDSMNIVITSSYKYSVTSSNVGTILLVDDLGLSFNSGVEQQNNNNCRVTYSPSKSIIIDRTSANSTQISITSSIGQEVSSSNNSGNHIEINACNLKNGLYFVHLSSGNENLTSKIWVY